MTDSSAHYLNPKCEVRPNPAKGNFGIFARKRIKAGELLAVWGGVVINGREMAKLPDEQRMFTVQIEEDLYQLSVPAGEGADFFNHSCEPNAGLNGQIAIMAMRAIQPEEEICLDYAMCDGSVYDEFECGCGTPSCRGQVTGADWMSPDLQEKYAGYFSPYLQRRINKMKTSRKHVPAQHPQAVPLQNATM